MADHWLDIMPAIPLARGVPMRKIGGDERLVGVCWDIAPSGMTARGSVSNGGEWEFSQDAYTRGHSWRVDLDDPQGFGYALRHLFSLGAASAWFRLRALVGRPPESSTEQRLHLLTLLTGEEETTDADRLALAQALAEVSR